MQLMHLMHLMRLMQLARARRIRVGVFALVFTVDSSFAHAQAAPLPSSASRLAGTGSSRDAATQDGAGRAGSDSTRASSLAAVRVTGRADNLIGTARSASEGFVGRAELRARPRARQGEILETIPGMIVTQHSGSGKANQYFVRGFNLDHGTDFRTVVEGMPVNMPSHGHGQGYTDLNFLIPETVDHIDYALGAHHAAVGDFGSAGAATINLIRAFDRPVASVEYGANSYARALLGGSPSLGKGTLLGAATVERYDGPWVRPDGAEKFNAMARYSLAAGRWRSSVLGMAYHNRWNATDQIPRRAVSNPLASRFASLDSTTGGVTGRYSLSASLSHAAASSLQSATLYAVHSSLNLVSNFTYFLDDPELGDEFAQADKRTVVGGVLSDSRVVHALRADHAVTMAIEARADIVDGLGLYRASAGKRRSPIRTDRVRQTSTAWYGEAQSTWSPRFRSVVGARADLYTFSVQSDRSENSGFRAAGIVSPKLSLVFTPSSRAEWYASGGFGFHSNDARGTTIRVEPVSGYAVARVSPLVRSRGAELGVRASPVRSLRSTISLWALDLDSELLFIGDGGATEPTNGSARAGITLANFYRPWRDLAIDADASFAHARFTGQGNARSRIPGALEQVFAGGVAWSPLHGAFAALRTRYFGGYPLDEGNAVRASSSMLLNADAGYTIDSGARLQLTMLNVLNARADDIQYFYRSRLPGEPAAGVDDVHFHPAEPRQLRLSLAWQF